MKKKVILLIISITLILVILFSSSYALLFKSDTTDKQSYTTGVLSITSETTNNSVTLNNSLPMSDSDGANTTPYTFKITNTGNLSYKFNVMLLSTTTENQISAEYIKIKVDDNEITKLSDLTDGIILSDITLKPEENIEISLRVWLDENTPNTEIGKNFNAKITTEGEAVYTSSSLDKSGANSPDLVQGLIPVMYDETSSSWVKADVTNTNEKYKWYDYSNKLWANAVLISDSGFVSTSKEVNISGGADIGDDGSLTIKSTNAGVNNSTSSTLLTITSPTLDFGAQSIYYDVSSEVNDKFTLAIDDVVQQIGYNNEEYISGETTGTWVYEFDEEKETHTILLTFTKDASAAGGQVHTFVTLNDILMAEGNAIKLTDASTYPWATLANFFSDGFSYDSLTKKYRLADPYIMKVSSSVVGKYMCPDITQTECSTVYKITEVNNNVITKVEEYSYNSTGTRASYQNASAGTLIPENNILAYYVWIPRYKYKVWNISKQAGDESTYAYNAYTEGIDIKFENEKESTGTISCTYNFNVDSANGGIDLSTTTAETCTGNNGDYYTHPAFTFGDDELRGFWISKFEMSSSNPTASNGGGNVTNLTVRSLPNVNSWRFIKINNVNTVIQNMQVANNIYGLSTSRTNTDSHMIKNMEWGAVAYLTNSNYGRCANGTCTEVTINNCSTYITGIGGDTVSASSSSTTCITDANKYNGVKGKLASTTSNITGVYDMSGGSFEFAMGNISSVTSGYTFYPSSSVLASSWYTSNQKYVDTYAYSTTSNNQASYNRGRLGDATAEILLTASSSGGWYGDYAYFPYSSSSWFNRGGAYNGGSLVGQFGFYYVDGYNTPNGSSRLVLVSLST